MAALFHLIFQLVKISLLASLYALIAVGLISIIPEAWKISFVTTVKSEKKKHWFLFGAIISILLFLFSFTYFGDHGLGDSARIPIGNWETIENINWTEYGTLKNRETGKGNQIITTKFKVSNNVLCGNLESHFYDYSNNYFCFNLKTKELKEYRTESEFNTYVRQNNLPSTSELQRFRQNYSDYWHGIRFVFLP